MPAASRLPEKSIRWCEPSSRAFSTAPTLPPAYRLLIETVSALAGTQVSSASQLVALRGSVAGRAPDPNAPLALAAIFLGAGLLRSIWIDLDFAAFQFSTAEIDRGVDRVLDLDHFHEAEAPGTAGDFVGDHQRAADSSYFGEERAQNVARN